MHESAQGSQQDYVVSRNFFTTRQTPGGSAPRNHIGGPKEAEKAENCQSVRYNRDKLLGKNRPANQFGRLLLS